MILELSFFLHSQVWFVQYSSLSSIYLNNLSSSSSSSISMEQSSSHLNEDAEECSSSESGWTMYLASPMHDGSHGDDDDDDDDDDDGDTISNGDNVQGKEDDDSMASDASSGTPCKQWKDDDDGMCHVNHGNGCREDGGDDVVKEKKSQCSSRYSRKNHNVQEGAGKQKEETLPNPSDRKEANGDSISIRSSSKMN